MRSFLILVFFGALGVFVLRDIVPLSLLQNLEVKKLFDTVELPSIINLSSMTITSPEFGPNDSIPPRFTCDGANVSPSLTFENIPSDAQTLALIVDDPDAPGGDWVHWILWNIPVTETRVAADSVPDGATAGVTSFGTTEYGGPCPPSGIHRYQFKLYALSDKLQLNKSADKKELLAVMPEYILAEAMLVGVYSRE